MQGAMTLPTTDGVEISPGIFLIGEPTPIEGTTKLRCLANVNGALAVVELTMKFGARGDSAITPHKGEIET
jgi:hypothetical protein